VVKTGCGWENQGVERPRGGAKSDSLIASKTGHLGRTFKAGEPGGNRTRDDLIKRKVAKPAVFWVSSQRKLAANLFDFQTIRLTPAHQIRSTTCPENV
jgi:hypothetical protein